MNRKIRKNKKTTEKCKEPMWYLVVSPTKKKASALCKRLGDYLYNKSSIDISLNMRVLSLNTRILIADPDGDTNVRFVSEREFYEAFRGFRSYVVDETDVEKWLDAAEE